MGQLKKLKHDELKEEFDKCVEKVEKIIPMKSELEASNLKRTGINLQAEVLKKQKITDVPDVTKDESVKREEELKSDTEGDVEAYVDERVDEPSSEEFQMGCWMLKYEIAGLKKNMKEFLWGDLKTVFDPPSTKDAGLEFNTSTKGTSVGDIFIVCVVHCYSGFNQPPQYSINHQEDLNQQRINDVHNGWDKIDELHNELLQMIQSFCEKFLQQKQAASIDQSPLQEMSLQEMEDLKQHYLDEMLNLSNDLQIKDYRNEKIDIRFRRECEDMIDELKGKYNGMSIEINKKKELRQIEQAAKLSTYTTEPSRHFNCTCYDDDDYEESTIPLNEIDSQIPPSFEITPVLPTLESEDSLIMGDEHLSTIPEKESNEIIKSSVEGFVLIQSESEDTAGSDSYYDLPSCDNFSPINVYEEKAVTCSNSLFDSNDDFTFSDDESLSDEDVPEDNFKIYLNPLFEFDDEYISGDVNPLFDDVLEDIECKDSYVSNLDESIFLVTPLSDYNEDECLTLSDGIELLLHHGSSISIVSILEGFTDEPPLKENDDLFDLESKMNDWKKILYDAPI
ncbi:hypothetical protein Tco_0582061, partial [Tanacetum coccineum]